MAQRLDDLAAATAQLLIAGPVQPQSLVDPNAAMAARDAVLVQLRQLIGSIAVAPRFATVRELTLHDVVHRPAQALHQTLSELPRAVSFGTAELGAAQDKTLTAYERAWQQAARTTIGLSGLRRRAPRAARLLCLARAAGPERRRRRAALPRP